MEGVELLSFQALWFVVAGFILGFATSTLWEWLYYRGKRRAPAAPPSPASAALPRGDDPPASTDAGLAEQRATPWKVPYRSPRVYLESESPVPLASVTAQPPPGPAATAPIADQSSTSTASPDPNAPRLNPATLAALQAAVADTPIAQTPASPSAGAQPFAGQGGAHTMVYPAPPLASPAVAESATAKLFAPPAALSDRERAGADAASSVLPTDPTPTAMRAASPPPSEIATLQSGQPLHTVAVAPTDMRDHPDDLALIKGVGEAYKRRLYGAGLYTWRQVAESDTETLRRITRAKPNANIGAWRHQAQELAEKFQRWQTTFQGPLDDFTHIDGIGAITADILYKAGICTYDQLAGALPDELTKIVPAPTVGDEIDFDRWINTAVRLANTKRRNQGLLS